MKKIATLIFLLGLLSFSIEGFSQKEPRNKYAEKSKKERKKESKDVQVDLQKQHKKKQTKETRKMMKKTKKRSERIREGKHPEPFFRRLFTKG